MPLAASVSTPAAFHLSGPVPTAGPLRRQHRNTDVSASQGGSRQRDCGDGADRRLFAWPTAPSGWAGFGGQTGTTRFGDTTANKDAWMVGYTPSLSTAVWVETVKGDEPLVTLQCGDLAAQACRQTSGKVIWTRLEGRRTRLSRRPRSVVIPVCRRRRGGTFGDRHPAHSAPGITSIGPRPPLPWRHRPSPPAATPTPPP